MLLAKRFLQNYQAVLAAISINGLNSSGLATSLRVTLLAARWRYQRWVKVCPSLLKGSGMIHASVAIATIQLKPRK